MARTLTLPRPPAAASAALARYAPVVVLLLAAIALVIGEFMTFREIKAVTVVPQGGTTTGGSHHGYALAVLGLAAIPMVVGAALGGSRPAAAALTGIGAVALAIVLIIDLPSLDDAGLIGRTYDLAKAHPAAGFWLQLVSSFVLLGGGLLLLLRNSSAAASRAEVRERERAARREEPADPADPEPV